MNLLNDYFTLMVDIVFKHRGILDKYLGDGLMAVFGVPLPTGQDPDNAVRAAVDMIAALKEFNRHRVENGYAPLNTNIGINTDEILSGNIGSDKRMDYTVIGDGVNLASRLEQANKLYKTNILLSETTYGKLKGQHKIRTIDLVRVRGKTKPVTIYQVMHPLKDQDYRDLDEFIETYQEGMLHFRRREWETSSRYFQQALEINPQDFPAELYLNRSRYFLKNPIGDAWSGICVIEPGQADSCILPQYLK